MPDVGDAINSNIAAIKVKWYDTILLLIGTILAAADPVTDILTLREFYLNDHKTWFGVGLVFLILPSLNMSHFYFANWRRGRLRNEESDDVKCIDLIPDLTLGWNPLALAYMRFKTFILCFKNFNKLWQENLEDDCNKKNPASIVSRPCIRKFSGKPGVSSPVHNPAICYSCPTGTSYNYPNNILVCFFFNFSVGICHCRCVAFFECSCATGTQGNFTRQIHTKSCLLHITAVSPQ